MRLRRPPVRPEAERDQSDLEEAAVLVPLSPEEVDVDPDEPGPESELVEEPPFDEDEPESVPEDSGFFLSAPAASLALFAFRVP